MIEYVDNAIFIGILFVVALVFAYWWGDDNGTP